MLIQLSLIMYVDFGNLSMVLNRLLELGLTDSPLSCYIWDFRLLWQILGFLGKERCGLSFDLCD